MKFRAKSVIGSLACAVLIMGTGFVQSYADTTPAPNPAPGNPAPPNSGEKTEAQANCVWGTTSKDSFQLAQYQKVYAGASDWRTDNPPKGECNIGIVFMPNSRGIGTTSLTAYADQNNFGQNSKSQVCTDGADPNCAASKWAIMFAQSTFYKCSVPTDLNCIFDFSIKDSSGNPVTVTYEKSFPNDQVKPAYNGGTIKYPAGGNPSIWSFNTQEGTTKVLINGFYDIGWESSQGQWRDRPGSSFQLFILPITENPRPSDLRGSDCYGLDATTCIRLLPSLPTGYTYKVSLNLTDGPTMFLNGRLDNPVAYTEPITGGHRFTIEAGASPALSVAQWLPKSIIPKEVVSGVAAKVNAPFFDDLLRWSNSEMRLSSGEIGAVDLFNAMLPYIGDKANFVHNLWAVTNNPSSDRYSQNCRNQVAGQILGIVSTNATAYRGDPPTYNASDSSLEYEVSGPHYLPDGKTESTGRYSINMNSKFLQCLLGVSKVPSTATIGLTYGSGEASVATLVVNQDKDWLRLNYDNFHYSTPTIKIKFIQTKTDTTGKSAVPAKPKVASAGNKTLTCIKGKQMVKVNASNGKCPKGYTKK